MKIEYSLKDHLDWDSAEKLTIHPPGWKNLQIAYIHADPHLIWRIVGVPGDFRSNVEVALHMGLPYHFAGTLMEMKKSVMDNLSAMPEERKKFYEEHIIGLFENE